MTTRGYMQEPAYLAGFAKAFNPNQQRDAAGRWVGQNIVQPGVAIIPVVTAVRALYDAVKSKITGGSTTKNLWHGTSSEALKFIRQDGLIPSKGIGSDIASARGAAAEGLDYDTHLQQLKMGDRAASVYITQSWAWAQLYASSAAEITESSPIILRIRIPAEHQDKIVPDEGERGHQWRFAGNIPPKWIDEYHGKNWHSLSKMDVREFYVVVPIDANSIEKAYDPEEARDERGRWSGGRGVAWIKERGGSVFDKVVVKLRDPKTAKEALAIAISAAMRSIGHMDQGNLQDDAVLHEVQNFANNAKVSVSKAKEIFVATVDGLLKLRRGRMKKDEDEITGDLQKLKQVLTRLDMQKMVPYAEAKPYMREDAYIAGRAGASSGPMRADPYFSERASARRSGPDQGGMKDPKRRKLPVADMSTVERPTPRTGHRFDGEAPISGDDMVPGSRLRALGRQRTL